MFIFLSKRMEMKAGKSFSERQIHHNRVPTSRRLSLDPTELRTCLCGRAQDPDWSPICILEDVRGAGLDVAEGDDLRDSTIGSHHYFMDQLWHTTEAVVGACDSGNYRTSIRPSVFIYQRTAARICSRAKWKNIGVTDTFDCCRGFGNFPKPKAVSS